MVAIHRCPTFAALTGRSIFNAAAPRHSLKRPIRRRAARSSTPSQRCGRTVRSLDV